VGGAILDAGLAHISRYAQVVLCGRISEYLKSGEEHLAAAEARMAEWIAAGRMSWQEDLLEGIEQMPRALLRLCDGSNIGKQLVRVAAPVTTVEPAN
jgi:NADPH-dependent curcumin reductase CurA